MELIELYLDAEDLYIEAVEQGLPFGSDLKLITCDDGTASGAASAVIAFTVQTPDGKTHRVQATTTMKVLLMALTVLGQRYDAEGRLRPDAPTRPSPEAMPGPGSKVPS